MPSSGGGDGQGPVWDFDMDVLNDIQLLLNMLDYADNDMASSLFDLLHLDPGS